MEDMASATLDYKENILDVLFTAEEVAGAVKRLAGGKDGGPDGLLAEHLKEGVETSQI